MRRANEIAHAVADQDNLRIDGEVQLRQRRSSFLGCRRRQGHGFLVRLVEKSFRPIAEMAAGVHT